MTISLQYCHITVNELDESLAFYRDALGLEVRNDVASGGFRWVTLGSAAQPDLEIVLSEPHAGRPQADGDALQELLVKGVLPMVVFRTHWGILAYDAKTGDRKWKTPSDGSIERLLAANQFVNSVIFVIGPQNLRSRRAVERIGGVLVGSRLDANGCERVVYQILAGGRNG